MEEKRNIKRTARSGVDSWVRAISDCWSSAWLGEVVDQVSKLIGLGDCSDEETSLFPVYIYLSRLNLFFHRMDMSPVCLASPTLSNVRLFTPLA